ncbi:AAA family ATPase [Inediibacterium massiliense]|uniref:AAA family ATPase n=1 Tax=Inediibacterium massiliense TaxID=1658111 RepID=UPI0006B42B4F|nr:AAA family ATPase [Inediibacterium massiliense]
MEENNMKNFANDFENIVVEVKKQIVGQDEIIQNVLIGIIAGGNILMEGAPGLGKTVLVKTFSKVLDLPFSRIQFTPDLMPTDILGAEIVRKDKDQLSFQFEKGPIFTSLLLADEINRATPKTQSALLEAMQERTVTVGKNSYILEEPFFVLATQNPLEMEGTYPLPEAQLDRFLFKLNVSLPQKDALFHMIDISTGEKSLEIKKIATKEDLLEMKNTAKKVPIAANIKNKAIDLLMSTHPDQTNIDIVKEYVQCGTSPRGIISMISAAKVKALSEGRYHVSLEDLYHVALPCLRHRMFLNFKAMADKVSTDEILIEIIKKVK